MALSKQDMDGSIRAGQFGSIDMEIFRDIVNQFIVRIGESVFPVCDSPAHQSLRLDGQVQHLFRRVVFYNPLLDKQVDLG